MQTDRSTKIICIGFWVILYFFMASALTTLLTRQILVKCMHINNDLVKLIYNGNQSLIEEANRYGGVFVEPIDWEKMFPHTRPYSNDKSANVDINPNVVDVYMDAIGSLKSDISNYVEDYFPWKIYMKWISGGYNLVTMGQRAALANDNIYVANDEWLYEYSLTDYARLYSDDDIEMLADEVSDFYRFLKDRNIGFIYASVSPKPSPFDNNTVLSENDRKRLNKKRFLQKLDERNVPEYDLSEMMPENTEDWYKLYFKTDAHWNDRGGLWASGVLAQYLNDNCGFSFDMRMYSPESYIEDTREKWFRGTIARGVCPLTWEKEELTRFIPLFKTDYTIVHYSYKGIEERNGSLTDVFFNNDTYNILGLKSEKDIYSGATGDYKYIENDDLYEITNHLAPDNKKKKILVIRDSFTSYVIPYFSVDVGEVDMVYMPNFTGSIRTYVDRTKPDAVIMLLYDRNIKPGRSGDSDYHFDLE